MSMMWLTYTKIPFSSGYLIVAYFAFPYVLMAVKPFSDDNTTTLQLNSPVIGILFSQP
jgi:hypothetical protein